MKSLRQFALIVVLAIGTVEISSAQTTEQLEQVQKRNEMIDAQFFMSQLLQVVEVSAP